MLLPVENNDPSPLSMTMKKFRELRTFIYYHLSDAGVFIKFFKSIEAPTQEEIGEFLKAMSAEIKTNKSSAEAECVLRNLVEWYETEYKELLFGGRIEVKYEANYEKKRIGDKFELEEKGYGPEPTLFFGSKKKTKRKCVLPDPGSSFSLHQRQALAISRLDAAIGTNYLIGAFGLIMSDIPHKGRGGPHSRVLRSVPICCLDQESKDKKVRDVIYVEKELHTEARLYKLLQEDDSLLLQLINSICVKYGLKDCKEHYKVYGVLLDLHSANQMCDDEKHNCETGMYELQKPGGSFMQKVLRFLENKKIFSFPHKSDPKVHSSSSFRILCRISATEKYRGMKTVRCGLPVKRELPKSTIEALRVKDIPHQVIFHGHYENYREKDWQSFVDEKGADVEFDNWTLFTKRSLSKAQWAQATKKMCPIDSQRAKREREEPDTCISKRPC